MTGEALVSGAPAADDPAVPAPGVTPATVLSVAVAALAVASSAFSLGGVLVLQRASGSTDFPVVQVVDVDSGAGDVEVVADSSGGTTVERRETWSFSRPQRDEQVAGGVLRLRSRCSGWSSTCDISYVVHVGRDVTVRVRSGSGDVEVRGAGAVDAQVGSGDLTVAGTSGDLVLRAGSGDLRLTGVTARLLTARTGSGDLDAALASPPQDVELSAGSGDLTLRLPDDGTTAYAVSTGTGSGDEQVRVRTDPSSAATLSARTGSGDLRIGYLPR